MKKQKNRSNEKGGKMKKILSLIVLSLIIVNLTGCGSNNYQDNNSSTNANQSEIENNEIKNENNEKVLTCTKEEKSDDSLKQIVKYVFTFDKTGSNLTDVSLSLTWKGDLSSRGINKTRIKNMFINEDFIHDKYEINEISTSEIEFIASRKIKDSDKRILGDLNIEHNETYSTVLEVMTEYDYKCN